MKKILLRLDLNVPLKNGRISDDFRITSSIPSIKKYLRGGNQVYLITHLETEGQTPHLDTIQKILENLLGVKLGFVRGALLAVRKEFSERVVLLDNIRLNPGEQKNDIGFAKRLASWGDFYVNDAFAVSHRKHASIVALPKLLPHEAGPLLKDEVANLSKFFRPKHPFLFVLGGKKFKTKEPLISKFLKSVDAIFIGGALANTFLAQRGFSVGKSSVENTKIPDRVLWHPKIMLPEDVIVLRGGSKKTVLVGAVEKNDLIYDAGPRTTKMLSGLANKAKFVLWNGTFGLCEEGFDFSTNAFAKSLDKSKSFRLIGGGDTVAAIRKMKLEKNFDFVSTGGGAMLEFLAKGTLPGIEALKK